MILHRTIRAAAAVLSALALLFAPPVLAREAAGTATLAPVQAGTPLRPALWLVRDADTTIYLFGTIHLLKPGLNWLNGPVAGALDGSDLLVTEMKLDEGGEIALQGAMLELAVLTKGQTLRKSLPPELRAGYEGVLARESIPPALYDGYKPWYVATVLSLMPAVKLGMVPDGGVEKLLAKAYGTGPHEGLETPEQQLRLFDDLSQDAQLAFLAAVVRDYDTIGPNTEALVEAWGRGDVERIDAIMNADADTPELVEALMTRRNQAWAGWIGRRLAQPGTVFVAVGAGHLTGTQSVQQHLAAAGIRTERVQ